MSQDEVVAEFERAMEADAKQFEKMANALEGLVPHLVGDKQKEAARHEVERRRAMARSSRELIKIVKGM